MRFKSRLLLADSGSGSGMDDDESGSGFDESGTAFMRGRSFANKRDTCVYLP